MGTRDGYRCCGTWECRLYFILKLVFLTYTAVFWLFGLVLLGLGCYAEVERRRYSTLNVAYVAPSVVMIIIGLVLFLISLIGLAGGLRDYLPLLKIFYYTLSVALVVQLAAGILALIFKDPTLELFNNLVRSGLRNYYNDLDLKNFVDFVQIESERMIPNTHCGYGTLKKERLELVAEISVRGCTHAVLLWFRDHLISMAALLLALIIPQLLGIVTTHFLIKTINKELQRQQQQQQNDSVDGMLRLPLEFDYKGCCPMYIPREELPHKTARQVIV
uniref:tetraspanin-15-like isoform X2 n=1 Tax=Myxine glutinosa TaxID=7769 RepID=UPI00358EF19F